MSGSESAAGKSKALAGKGRCLPQKDYSQYFQALYCQPIAQSLSWATALKPLELPIRQAGQYHFHRRRKVMNRKSLVIGLALLCMTILGSGKAYADEIAPAAPGATLLVTGMASGSGSTVGPGGALYVTEGATGRVLRVDPQTGAVTTFVSGLPNSTVGIGGAMDIAFIGKTAYVLVTLVAADVGGSDVVGIYRVDSPNTFSVLADIGAFSENNPPDTPYFIPTGVQYALETFRGGLLVTDGHHNRVLRVTLDGEITEMIAFGNNVPTGMAVSGNTVYMAEAGPVPHLPENGKVVAFGPKSSTATEVASGAPLLVDVEFGRGRSLFALSQGTFLEGDPEGAPALPNTGSLVQVNDDGTFSVLVDGLNQPTSLEFIGNTAYVVTLGGAIWKIDNISGLPYGVRAASINGVEASQWMFLPAVQN
jgi:sugar lactone lactonase YvrE